MMRQLAFALCALSILFPFMRPPTPSAASTPAALAAGPTVPPLPRSCIGGVTPLDYAQPICCVSGYVYLNGIPIVDAAVTISIQGRSLSTQTKRYPNNPLPYFTGSLGATPLNVQPGDSVTISASANGQSKSVSFIAQEGGQQVDVVLPQSQVEGAWVRGDIPGRSAHAMAYDSVRQRVVLFGGLINGGINDTWEWDGATWRQRTPTTSPSARYGHAMVYDAARQRVVLFGGSNNGVYLNDTWEWDGATWTQHTPSTSPSARYRYALAYDAARQRVVLFGGYDSRGTYLNDTWEWDGTTWTQRTPTISPSIRSEHALVYDAARQRVILFGGRYNTSYLNDTWAWDGTNWQRLSTIISPSARFAHALAYDAARQRVVLFGGNNGNSLNDTWEWDGATWTQRTPIASPPARFAHTLAYDVLRQRIVLFAGDARRDDTWEWDGTIWRHRMPPISPPPRHDSPLAYDGARQRLVLFGGYDSVSYLGDTWEWDGATWTQYAPAVSPSARSAHMFTYDPVHQRVLLFGGLNNNVALNDTWEWDGANWTQRVPATSPSARYGHALAYDAARQRAVLFGGFDSSGRLNDTWEWDGTTWAKRTPPTSPPARAAHALAYDAARQRAVLFGGFDGSGRLNDTWEWDGTTWTKCTPSTSPPARYDQGLAYDAARQRVVLFGGYPRSDDTWEWDGTTWTQRTPPISPPARSAHALAYDAARQRAILFNGYNGGSLNDTWEWDGTRWQLAMSDNFTQVGIHTSAVLGYEAHGTTLLFGGRDGATLKNDTYRWDGNGWHQIMPLHTPPAARYNARLVGNSDGACLLLFGGIGANNAYLDDTWLWDRAGDDWILQSPALKPAARAAYGLTYDRHRNVWLLFGGQGSNGTLSDTWEFDGAIWTQRTPAVSPLARSNATLTYDAARGRAVLIGGQHDAVALDDVWEWNGTNWIDVTPAQRLGARAGHAAAYDSKRNVVVVAGGTGNETLNDTWEWNGSYWRQRLTSPPLPAMTDFAMDYDARNDYIVVTGGEENSKAVEGIYLHRVTGAPTDAPPIATISRISPRDARQGIDTISFIGRGADTDSSDVITAYRWTTVQNGTVVQLSDQPSFTLAASAFPLGEQRVRLEVQDNEGTWSPLVEHVLFIRDGGAATSSNTKTWTLLLYAVADNNLDLYMGESAAANAMLYRLKSAGAQANVQLAVLYDGPGANDTRRYTLRSDGDWSSVPLPEARMDEMTTLSDFLRWGYATFKSDYYALSLVDHANGVVGFGQDNSSDSAGKAFLTPLELRSALEDATDSGGHKLDVLHIDGCSFGLLEDAAIAADLTHYLVVSPNTGWGIFPYDTYRKLAASAADPRSYAQNAAQTYAVAIGAQGLPYTISVFDMAHFAELNKRVSDFGEQLLTYINADLPARVKQLRSLRDSSQKYDSGGVYLEIDAEDSYVDLVDFATRVQTTLNDGAVQRSAGAVIDAVKGNPMQGLAPFVIYERHASGEFVSYDPFQGRDRAFAIDLSQATGLALFYPPRSNSDATSAYTAYVQHRLFDTTRTNGWTRFLAQGIPPQLSGDPAPMPNNVLIPPLTRQLQSNTPTATPTATTPVQPGGGMPTTTPTATTPTQPGAGMPTATIVPTSTPGPFRERYLFLPLLRR